MKLGFLRISILAALFYAFTVVSCSVISKDVREAALDDVDFKELLKTPSRYIGSSVLLGGFILETRNHPEKTEIVILQTPLSFRDEPGGKDESQGRFIITYQGFLDPEIFSKNRKITVAGTLEGVQEEIVDKHPYPYLIMENQEFYLWPKMDGYRYYPYRYPDPFYPCPFYRDPFYRAPYCW